MLSALEVSGDGLRDHPNVIQVADRGISRQQLRLCAGAVAKQVQGMEAVAVHATVSLETVVAITGALIAGTPVVPLSPAFTQATWDRILRETRAAAVLTTGRRFEPTDRPRLAVDLRRRSSASFPAVSPDAIALIGYTRGTTGPPKAVRLSAGAIAASIDAVADAWAWGPDDVVVHGLPMTRPCNLILGIIASLRIGSPLVYTGRPSPTTFAAAEGTLYLGDPPAWNSVTSTLEAARALRSARLLVSGESPLTAREFVRLAELTGHRPVEWYGMAEAMVVTTSRALGDRLPGYVGTPVGGVATRVVDGRGVPVPADGASVGELQVHGPTLFDGYLTDDREGGRHGGWFSTGDLATIGPGGRHRIVGRASVDLIKSGRHRVGATEVEQVLMEHPMVRDAAVTATPHPDLGQQVTAYVVADDGATAQDLIDFVARRLPAYKRPRTVHLTESLPQEVGGKRPDAGRERRDQLPNGSGAG
ncbi:acyl-CoA synthetase [Phytohabitans flavus]|uniref:Acyl-CoA synthetase n=1 Tax=Phytohabitans flavus TaxID=1076124 RepID=A0A6F8XKP1_9ACTN|nr:acyl-CoA synthetase [Phytohabitans flavus]